MSSSKLPVIFLAFANDKQNRSHYLRQVTREKNSIVEALEKVDGKLCEVLTETDVSINKIWKIFQSEKYRDRICIFHFGGHAHGFDLLLESWEGENALALGSGLVSFLSKQKSLKLIFLNGCSTQKLVTSLTRKGIPSAIGTTSPIYDNIAADLAGNFYRGLGEGIPIQKAWLEALDKVATEGTLGTRSLDLDDEDEMYGSGKDWFIEFHPGADQMKFWSLLHAADNPLFGLDLPEEYYKNLPEAPYKGLERFSEKDAGIFFGREQEIRDLFEKAKGLYPVILLYGQSGVGKSSLLDAGFLPRISHHFSAKYLRRDATKGLTQTLLEKFAIPLHSNRSDAQIAIQVLKDQLAEVSEKKQTNEVQAIIDNLLEEITLKSKAPNLLKLQEKWEALEKTAPIKPLIVILDQLEEAFTKPLTYISPIEEIEQLCRQIKELVFGKDAIKGKIILSFRKEYLSEIQSALKQQLIPYTEVPIKPLAIEGVIKAVEGIGINKFLREKYKTQIESDLPAFIGGKVLDDYKYTNKNTSPIAPVLQILLKKMWEKIEAEENRIFSIQLYYLVGGREWLNEFLDNVIKKIKAKFQFHEAVTSGFLFDLLIKFVTSSDTAAQVEEKVILDTYPKISNALIRPLVAELKITQLLYGFDIQNKKWLRIIHDSLATIVKKKYEASDLPVQKVSRTLHNHLRNKSLLSSEEIIFVKQWLRWYPKLSEKETFLLEKSQEENIKQLAIYYLTENDANQSIDLLDSYIRLNQSDKLYEFLLIKFRVTELEKSWQMGLISLDEYITNYEHIQKNLSNFINQISTANAETVLQLTQEHEIYNLLKKKETNLVLQKLELVLKELAIQNFIDELGQIKSRFLLITSMKEEGLLQEVDLNIEQAKIHVELINLCHQIDERYQLNIFKSFHTPKRPLPISTLSEDEKFDANASGTKSSIEQYLVKIKVELSEGQIEKPLLRLINLREILKEDLSEILDLEQQWIILKTQEDLHLLNWSTKNIHRRTIVQGILKQMELSVFPKIQEKNSKKLLSRKLSSDEILVRLPEVNLNRDKPTFRIILFIFEMGSISLQIRLLHYLALATDGSIPYSPDRRKAMQDALLENIIQVWKSELSAPETALPTYECKFIIPFLVRNFIIFSKPESAAILLSIGFRLCKEQKFNSLIEDVFRSIITLEENSIQGLIPDNQLASETALISVELLFLLEKLEEIIALRPPKNVDPTFETLFITSEAQHCFSKNKFVEGLNWLGYLSDNTNWQALKIVIKNLRQYSTTLDDIEDSQALTKYILFLCNEIVSAAKDSIKKPAPSNLAPNDRAFAIQLFTRNRFNYLLDLLHQNQHGDESKSLYEKLDKAIISDIFSKDEQPLKKLRIELYTLIEKRFPIVRNPKLLQENGFDKGATNKTLRKYIEGRISLDQVIEEISTIEELVPNKYMKICICLAEQNEIKRKNMQGLINWSEKMGRLVAVKQRVAHNYLEIQKVIDESKL